MATWMAHLRIAENLLSRIEGLNAAQFAIGNIAPDSGIPDENWEKFNPPPQVTHFKRSDSVHKDIADLDFYRKYLAGVRPQDSPRFSFRLGYFFHLVTDNLWTIMVGKPTEERYPAEFAVDKNFIWEVKRDWYGLDHIYVRAHADCLFWRVFLPFDPSTGSGRASAQAAPHSSELDFLPPEALHHQLEYIKTFYQRRDEKIEEMCARPFIYLSAAEMDTFVAETSEQLLRIYNSLWPTPPALDGLYSALELNMSL